MNASKKKALIAVCAMQRKAESKPMSEILARMQHIYGEWLSIIIFKEEMILNDPIEMWPHCDGLIGFHSTDFPLDKVIGYANLRAPYVLNDLQRQFDLLDRRKVYKTLARAGIEHPRYGVLDRNDPNHAQLINHGDSIEVNGQTFHKPFVEKPISAENHNICIYYQSSVGGGSQRLFRKINNRSSMYSPVSDVRNEGSYIYEDFIPADGTDVKVYAVGPYYAHAEARKAPALDGKVDRDSTGKEVRYPVILSNREKLIARKVVLAFGQTVCGFDLLRAGGKSYVCDVNGFSFVKTSKKYYDDTARILGNMILRRLAFSLSIPWKMPYQADDPPLVPTADGTLLELRCVLAVIRHGDRTPKQKLKLKVTDQRIWELFKRYDGVKKVELKLKKPFQLKEILDAGREILQELRMQRDKLSGNVKSDEKSAMELERLDDSIKKWEQLRTVLEMYGHFSGINRKVQLKYIKPSKPTSSTDDGHTVSENVVGTSTATVAGAPKNLLLVLKWGGELTPAGVLQAEALGKLFRTLYPGIRSKEGEENNGLGFLRLHSTYRHDLKIYASEEGRVQMTAAAFAKGMLALEGELPPILVQMVKSAHNDGLLDDDASSRQFQSELKKFLSSHLQMDREFVEEDHQLLNPTGSRSIREALEFIKRPLQMCEEILGYVKRMVDIIQSCRQEKPDTMLYLNESWELADRRWKKLLKEFRRTNTSRSSASNNSDELFDISKIPDIYDNIKYDMEHNPELCVNNEKFERMYLCVKNMADVIVPQEYGIRKDGKLSVAQRVCTPLLSKIRSDLKHCVEGPEEEEALTRLDPRASQGIATPLRHVRTRLYFTSESHLHTLMNLLRYGGLIPDEKSDKKWQRAMNYLNGVTELNYMTQVVLMLYEDSRPAASSDGSAAASGGNGNNDRHFHVELLFSSGLYPCFLTEKERLYEGTNFSGGNSSKASDAISSKSPRSISAIETPSVTSPEGVNSATSPNDTAGVSANGAEKRTSRQTSLVINYDEDMPPSPPGDDDDDERMEDELTVVPGERLSSDDADSSADIGDITLNLVSLSKVSKLNDSYTTEDLARHSPPLRASPPPQRTKRHILPVPPTNTPAGGNVGDPADSCISTPNILKSCSDIDCVAATAVGVGNDVAMAIRRRRSGSSERSGSPTDAARPPSATLPRRQKSASDANVLGRTISITRRFPYRFKHHTVNLLRDVENKLISTDVIFGSQTVSGGKEKRCSTNPAVLSTAVIARSSSAPRLQTYKAEDDISVSEIRRFWPPLRSLEMLHDNLGYKAVDEFLHRIITVRTPMPSPPRTPIALSRENSDLNSALSPPSGGGGGSVVGTSSDRTLRDTVERLSALSEKTPSA